MGEQRALQFATSCLLVLVSDRELSDTEASDLSLSRNRTVLPGRSFGALAATERLFWEAPLFLELPEALPRRAMFSLWLWYAASNSLVEFEDLLLSSPDSPFIWLISENSFVFWPFKSGFLFVGYSSSLESSDSSSSLSTLAPSIDKLS